VCAAELCASHVNASAYLPRPPNTTYAQPTPTPHPHPPTPTGRLNVLANVVRKPMAQIFSEFSGKAQKGDNDEYMGSGDVKVGGWGGGGGRGWRMAVSSGGGGGRVG